jgi:hypothetical protein
MIVERPEGAHLSVLEGSRDQGFISPEVLEPLNDRESNTNEKKTKRKKNLKLFSFFVSFCLCLIHDT